MNSSSKSFEDKFISCFSRILDIDFLKNGAALGVELEQESLVFNFFSRKIRFSREGIEDIEGNLLTPAVKYLLCNYLLNFPDPNWERSEGLVTLREIPGSGPLFSSFTANTGKIIKTSFSGKLKDLKTRSLLLGGEILDNPSFDISLKFFPFKMVPIILNFNDEDEMMGSSATFLFQDNAYKYLDLESLSIITTCLTGLLISDETIMIPNL